jgi:microcystin-dependent protein
MPEPFLGEIRMVGFTFPPRGWADCNGQLLSIAQNSALFALLGTTYGGDGQTTFALPDLRSRFPRHIGQGPGLSNQIQGETGGQEQVALIANQLPAHGHPLAAASLPTTSAVGNSRSAAGKLPATANDGESNYSDAAPDGSIGITQPAATGNTGGNQPHDNVPPYLAVRFVIALEGIFPQRN